MDVKIETLWEITYDEFNVGCLPDGSICDSEIQFHNLFKYLPNLTTNIILSLDSTNTVKLK